MKDKEKSSHHSIIMQVIYLICISHHDLVKHSKANIKVNYIKTFRVNRLECLGFNVDVSVFAS